MNQVIYLLFTSVSCSLCMAPLSPALYANETAPAEYWQLEYGAGTLQRSMPWQQAESQHFNFPLLSARRGNWRLGVDGALLQYQWQQNSHSLSAGIGLRDEVYDSRLWGKADSNDPVFDGYRSDGGDTTFQLRGGWGWLNAGVEQDISSHSGALTADASITLPLFYLQGGTRAQLLAGTRWLSESYSRYVYGISPEQSNALRPEYQPQQAFNPQLTLQALWPISPQWLLRLRWQQEWLDDTLQDSPLVGQPVSRQAMLLLSWSPD